MAVDGHVDTVDSCNWVPLGDRWSCRSVVVVFPRMATMALSTPVRCRGTDGHIGSVDPFVDLVARPGGPVA
jgi:hypothetical protein